MIILGIDPGTASTGYAFIRVNRRLRKGASVLPKILTCGVITTGKDLEMPSRLKYIHFQLSSLCKKYKPDTMVIEKLFFNTNVKTAMTVGQARGVTLLVGAESSLDIYEYTALQAKLVLTGYGRAEKAAMQQAVKDYLKLANCIKPDDANDAVAMVLCHISKSIEG